MTSFLVKLDEGDVARLEVHRELLEIMEEKAQQGLKEAMPSHTNSPFCSLWFPSMQLRYSCSLIQTLMLLLLAIISLYSPLDCIASAHSRHLSCLMASALHTCMCACLCVCMCVCLFLVPLLIKDCLHFSYSESTGETELFH